MQNLRTCLLLLFSAFFLWTACKEDETLPKQKFEEGSIEFAFSMPSSVNQRVKSDSASNLLITVIDSTGNTVLERHKIKLYQFSGNYISEPVSFNAGNYQLTEFLVLNANDEVIYATPKKSAKLDYLVQNALPFDFSVSIDQTQKVASEVISANSASALDFGYSTFTFQVVKTFDFLMGVFTYDAATENFELTDAHMTIWHNNEILFDQAVGDSTNQIKVKDGDFPYKIIIDKEGYNTYEQEFTASELKEYTYKPLIVNLFSNLALDSGLVAYYPFSGNALDATDQHHDGTVEGATLKEDKDGNLSEAYEFDGQNDKIMIGDELDFANSAFSLSFLVNVDEFTGQNPGTETSGSWVINKGITIYGNPSRAGYGIKALMSDGKNYIQFYVGNQNDEIFLVEMDGFSEEKWYHITVVRNAQQLKMYVNGSLASTYNLPGNFSVNTNIPLVFGSIDKLGNDIQGTTYFNGMLDDVRFYDRELTAEEIAYLASH